VSQSERFAFWWRRKHRRNEQREWRGAQRACALLTAARREAPLAAGGEAAGDWGFGGVHRRSVGNRL